MTTPAPSFLGQLASGLSAARLAGYRLSLHEANAAVIGRYLWDLALAGALLPAIHLLEVGLRNRLDGAITGLAGAMWFDHASVVVDERAQAQVRETRARIATAGGATGRDAIVAGLPFGFWVGLCGLVYEAGPRHALDQVTLWPSIAKVVVPYGPRRLRVRSVLWDRLGGVRVLRNRVYHHEPIWNGRRDHRGNRVALSVDAAMISELLSALDPTLRDMLRMAERFDDLYDGGVAPWEALVTSYGAARGYAP